MRHIQSTEPSWIEKEGYSKRVFVNGGDMGLPGILVQEVRIKPREEAASHFHSKQTEIFYFLNSNGFFVVDGVRIDPKPGDIIVVEPDEKHIVTNNTESDFLYIAFKANWSEDDIVWE